ncbi:dTDP-4-dehydrorhamnose 3,5-epimerase [Ideonella sp. B508-1]|uniref:dTDP-4-dehydrorhamnose 3,5-epimerase family protein n=1 Tax=Ideonella sp. B508-1 TaxID=137716 RepID=UPI0003470E4E
MKAIQTDIEGVLRGQHAQKTPHAQGKLVRVTADTVFDVAVEIRKDSPSFGRWVGVALSADKHCQFWIPPALAIAWPAIGMAPQLSTKDAAATAFAESLFS